VGHHFAEIDLAAAGQLVLLRHHQHQAILAEGDALDALGQRMLGGKAEVGNAGGDGARDLAALAFLHVDGDALVLGEEAGERLRQIFRDA
jgi:hypothetical protein